MFNLGLCNVEADLTTGEVKYGESSLMRLSEDLDSGFVDEKGCKMKGVLEVDFAQMKVSFHSFER